MSTAEIEIYSDEIVVTDSYNKKFIGICCLFIPTDKKKYLINILLNKRCLFSKNKQWILEHSNCVFSKDCKLNWHKGNSCEIHHKNIKKSRASYSQIEIAKKWLKYLIEKNKQNKNQIYFNILYIDLDTLNIEYFGKEKTHENIYNKFFRTAIRYGVKSFFGNFHKVLIKKVCHDKGSMEFHNYFPNLNLSKVDDLAKNIIVEDKNIHFLDSNHNIYLKNEELYQESQLIQYTDLLLGSISQNIFYSSDDTLKKEIAMIIRPLVDELLKNTYNKNSSLNYYGKQHIGFFPRNKVENVKQLIATLDGDTTESFRRQFYSDRTIEMPPFNQQNLSFWCYNETTN